MRLLDARFFQIAGLVICLSIVSWWGRTMSQIGRDADREPAPSGLERLNAGDPIRIVTPDGEYVYRVERTEVVASSAGESPAPEPEPRASDDRGLESEPSRVLTIMTVYPLRLAGPGPRRFVVRARAVGSDEARGTPG